MAILIGSALAACAPQASARASVDDATAADGVAAQPSGEAQTGLRQVPLIIHSASGEHRFTVEVAGTPEQQERGLMFRTSLAGDRGMIFPYDPPQEASFWMKNTLIPLDMVFIGADGRVVRVAANATPMSLDPIASGAPVSGVLELRGGRAAELGIRKGDLVTWTH
jgi:uncharacterized protein